MSTVPKGLGTLEISAGIRVDTEFFPDALGHISVLGVTFVDGSAYVEIRRSRTGASLVLSTGETVPLLQPFPVGSWKTIEMRFAFGSRGTAPRVVTYIDAVPSGSAPLPADVYRSADSPRVLVGPGVATGPLGVVRMNVDNVSVRGSLLK